MTVLNEKNVAHDIEYIDLRNKPDWFLAISPTGRVPVVQTSEGDTLFESAVISEYFDEIHEPHFMPDTPLARAQDRMWMDFVSGLYGDAFRLYNAADQAAAESNLESAKQKLAKLEEIIDGPLFNGEEFSLVDATAAPPFMRLNWVSEISAEYDVFVDAPKSRAWKDALLARQAVQDSVLPDLRDIFMDSVQQKGGFLAGLI